MTYTEAERDLIAKLWNEGLSATEIGAKVKRSRNAVIGIVTRMRDAGDPRVIRSGGGVQKPWTDEELLDLMQLRENERLAFPKIGQILKRPTGSCSQIYHDIIRDMKSAGMI